MHVSYRSGILLAAPPAVCGPRSAVVFGLPFPSALRIQRSAFSLRVEVGGGESHGVGLMLTLGGYLVRRQGGIWHGASP